MDFVHKNVLESIFSGEVINVIDNRFISSRH